MILDFIADPGKSFWGGAQKTYNGEWRWFSGRLMEAEEIGTNNGDQEFYGRFYKNSGTYLFHDLPCGHTRYVLCLLKFE